MADEAVAGTRTKARIADVLRRHVVTSFGGNEKRAAEDLGYERQRLHSYISTASFPGADAFDHINDKWQLDLLNVDARRGISAASNGKRQLLLFDPPVRLTNEGVEIVLERKGAAVAVGITISPDVKVA